MKLEFGRCPKCQSIIELNSNKIFICPYCEEKITKEDAKNNLDSELNDRIIASQITETINKAKKEQEKGNYIESSKLYHEVISINPYNIESYIGLIITKTDNFTKKPIIKNCTLETVNIKELEKIIEILSKLSKDEYSDFINQTKLYIDNYRKMVEEVEDNTLYIQLKMLNEDNNKEKEIKNPYVKKILYILCLIISIIIFVIEPIYGFIFLIISSITIGLLKK
mgnify:FL=1